MTPRTIAEFANHWLANETQRKKNLWVWTDPETGLDIAHQMLKQQVGDFSGDDIPFDGLPAYAANAYTENRAFIASQQDHIETILVTMQDAAAPSGTRRMTDDEKNYFNPIAEAKGVGELEELDYIDQPKDHLQIKAPDILLVDYRFPDWEYLKRFIAPSTKVMMTDRVEKNPPTNT